MNLAKYETLAAAVEQGSAEFILQRPYVLGQCRLRDEEALSGLCEVKDFG